MQFFKNLRHKMPKISDGKESGYFFKGSLDPVLKHRDCASPPVQLIVRRNLNAVVDYFDKKKHDIVFQILEKLLSLLSHLYKKTVDENHSVESKHISAISLAATMIIVYCFQFSEKSAKNTVLLKK